MKSWFMAPFVLCFQVEVCGQLVINEVCSQNARTILDPSGEYHDWVELVNTGGSTISLGSYYLSDDLGVPHAWSLPAMDLAPGAFVLLFHGDANPDGLHFPFKLSAHGESLFLSDAGLDPIDVLHLPALHVDHSVGRDGAGNIAIYTSPTPGSTNGPESYPGYAPAPIFNTQPGFHTGGISVSIQGCDDCELRFSTDGRDPDQSGVPVTGGIQLGYTTTLKAITYRDGYLPSEVITGTYIINSPTKLPVVALSTHPDSLFDETLGLYMLGPEAEEEYPYWGANFWDERGITVRFEYFDERSVKRVDQDVELRIHGGRASRNKPQRPLRLTARDHLGDDRIRYGFFPEKPELEDFKRIILRNAGGDWCQAHYRDGFFHQVAQHAGLDIDVLAFKPSATYINGQYWGILNIRERVDEDYLASNYGADPDELLLMDEENHVIQGDSLHFDTLQQFIRTHDMADDVHFRHVDSLIDLHSLIDYFALEMFAGNSDWPSNNLKYWKPSVSEGKWRYLMYDMDAAMAAAPWLPNDFDMFFWVHVHREGFIHAEIYQSLIQRPEFRRQFLNRLADLMNTCLSPKALHEENDRIRATIIGEIPRHFQRWWTDVSVWNEHSGEIIPEWIDQRADHMRNDVLEWYELPNTAKLKFDLFPREAGTFQLNTISPELPFDGIYFNGNDIDVSVEPAPGFTFSYWTYSAEPDSLLKSPHMRRSFAADGTLVAHFAKNDAVFYAFPNPAGNACELSYEASQTGVLEISLWDAQGRQLGQWKMNATAGVNRVPIDLLPFAAGVYEARAELESTRQTIRIVKH